MRWEREQEKWERKCYKIAKKFYDEQYKEQNLKILSTSKNSQQSVKQKVKSLFKKR